MPNHKYVLSTILLFFAFIQASLADLPSDLSGTYQFQGDIRKATISKIEIKKLKGQTLVHVWFYGRPDDVDWGEVPATEYKNDSMKDLTVIMQHDDARAILVIRVAGFTNEKIQSITVQSWTDWKHQDARHQNEAAQDTLAAFKTGL